MEKVNHLRYAVESEKDRIIQELISNGHTKLADGRQLYELTLSELENEMRWVNKKHKGGALK
ncbi:Fur-regulated basic protein FbpA [Bacillus sp. FJAT-45350]|uniref:Fur-regulated basic protein FbpA n=1 Tax=Bacillus sp. FJAT-45350 TaxID=2011014 RepID=UPI000BB97B1C|nr:Fur-regulated basic protein FbpA [Bacillus sp. FJAT-45350]